MKFRLIRPDNQTIETSYLGFLQERVEIAENKVEGWRFNINASETFYRIAPDGSIEGPYPEVLRQIDDLTAALNLSLIHISEPTRPY